MIIAVSTGKFEIWFVIFSELEKNPEEYSVNVVSDKSGNLSDSEYCGMEMDCLHVHEV